MNQKASNFKHLKFFVLILGVCFMLLLGRLLKTGGAIGGDAVYYYSALRSIAIDRNLNLENEYLYFHNQTSNFTKNRKIPKLPPVNQKTGKYSTHYPIGSAVLLLPFFLTAHLIAKFIHIFLPSFTTDGFGIFYQGFSATGSLLYGFAGILLVYISGRKFFDSKNAFWGTIFIWLATPLIYYMTMEPLNSQTLSFFGVGLLVYLWLTFRKDYTFLKCLILGFVGGLLGIIRFQDILFLLLPLTDLVLKKRFRFFPTILISALVGMVPQFLANNYLYGSPLTNGYSGIGFPYLLSPKIIYSLFSAQRGLLVWSPIIIFSFIGLAVFIKKFKSIGLSLMLMFLIQLYIVSSWADPTQGDSFGNRILLNCSIIFALGLMGFLNRSSLLFKILFSFFVVFNLFLAILFIFRIIGQPY